MSANEVLTALLDAMPDSYQKTIGFPTYDLLAAVSLRLAETDAVIEDARAALDPENLTGTSTRAAASRARRRPSRAAC